MGGSGGGYFSGGADAGRQELISRAARLAFPIRGGIPFLVREEARQLD